MRPLNLGLLSVNNRTCPHTESNRLRGFLLFRRCFVLLRCGRDTLPTDVLDGGEVRKAHTDDVHVAARIERNKRLPVYRTDRVQPARYRPTAQSIVMSERELTKLTGLHGLHSRNTDCHVRANLKDRAHCRGPVGNADQQCPQTTRQRLIRREAGTCLLFSQQFKSSEFDVSLSCIKVKGVGMPTVRNPGGSANPCIRQPLLKRG